MDNIDLLTVGDRVLIAGEWGTIIDKMTDPLTRIKVDFDGDKYPRPLWVSLRLINQPLTIH